MSGFSRRPADASANRFRGLARVPFSLPIQPTYPLCLYPCSPAGPSPPPQQRQKRPAPPCGIAHLSHGNAPRTPDSARALVPAPWAPYRPFYGHYSADISVRPARAPAARGPAVGRRTGRSRPSGTLIQAFPAFPPPSRKLGIIRVRPTPKRARVSASARPRGRATHGRSPATSRSFPRSCRS